MRRKSSRLADVPPGLRPAFFGHRAHRSLGQGASTYGEIVLPMHLSAQAEGDADIARAKTVVDALPVNPRLLDDARGEKALNELASGGL